MQNETLDQDMQEGLSLSPITKDHLGTIARWGKFLSIVGFVFIGLFFVVAIFIYFAMGDMPANPALPFPMSALSIVYIILALIYIPPIYFLYQFSSSLSKALKQQDQGSAESSIKSLKNLFVFMGIFTLVIIGIYALAFLGGLMSALF